LSEIHASALAMHGLYYVTLNKLFFRLN